MSGNEIVKVSKNFAADFEAVATHYRLRELGEYEQAKESARRDLANAIETYAVLAGEVMGNATEFSGQPLAAGPLE